MTKRYYHYARMGDASLSMIINKELEFKSPVTFNDPFDGQLDLKAALEFALQSLQHQKHIAPYEYLKNICAEISPDDIVEASMGKGVFCLSTDYRNILMWSHYAAKHTGFCIRFDFSNTDFAAMLNKVQYTADNPYLKTFHNESQVEKTPDELIRRLYSAGIRYKHNKWKYEKEFRLVRTTAGFEAYPSNMLKEIIFGLRMKPEHKKTLINLLSGHEWKHVKFKQIEQDGTSLRLKVRPAKKSDYCAAHLTTPVRS